MKMQESAFHCQHVLARRGQVGVLVSSSWYAIGVAGLRGQTQLLLGAGADTEGCWKGQPHKLPCTCGAAMGVALTGEDLNVFLGRAVQQLSTHCTATQAFVSDHFLLLADLRCRSSALPLLLCSPDFSALVTELLILLD